MYLFVFCLAPADLVAELVAALVVDLVVDLVADLVADLVPAVADLPVVEVETPTILTIAGLMPRSQKWED